jgi:hypothetical protein
MWKIKFVTLKHLQGAHASYLLRDEFHGFLLVNSLDYSHNKVECANYGLEKIKMFKSL